MVYWDLLDQIRYLSVLDEIHFVLDIKMMNRYTEIWRGGRRIFKAQNYDDLPSNCQNMLNVNACRMSIVLLGWDPKKSTIVRKKKSKKLNLLWEGQNRLSIN